MCLCYAAKQFVNGGQLCIRIQSTNELVCGMMHRESHFESLNQRMGSNDAKVRIDAGT